MDKKELGLRIKCARKEKGLSQKELATLMGYKDVSTITKIETGVNDVTTETLFKLCTFLSASIFDILRDDCSLEDEKNYIRRIRKYVGHQKIILNAAGGIIVKDNKILLQKRSDNNAWGLPGGMLEVNETYLEAAIREIKEETGLIVKPVNYLGIYHNHNMIYPNKDESHVICAIYIFEIVSGELRLDEESLDLKFFSKDELPVIFASDHRLAINDYFMGVKHDIISENRK